MTTGWQQATELDKNVALRKRPATGQVVVRPNQYEPGRAHIIINNPEQRRP
ncbi:MAG: hypothetical protein U0Y68_02220 [Blastocatellia bacterium]